MTYEELRNDVRSGDVIGANSGRWFAKLVKALTKEDFSHVAMFVWHGSGLWIYEFVEGTGYQCMPASQWFTLREGQKMMFGRCPEKVNNKTDLEIQKIVGAFRSKLKSQHYGYISLAVVFFAQLFKKKLKTRFKVCSTFVQYVWEECGYNFKITADPGDVMRAANSIEPLTEITNIDIGENYVTRAIRKFR